MGLDIYFYKTKKKIADNCDGNIHVASKLNDMDFQKTIERRSRSIAKRLEKVTGKEYDEAYKKEILRLGKLFTYPQFDLGEVGFKYDWETWESTIEPMSIDAFKKGIKTSIKNAYAPSCAYFRKVNFIYAFFSAKEDFEDECVWVTLDDVNELIERCEKVLKENDDEVSEELLPTQSGFFFGSTNYDEWYYKDVEDCLKQMKELKKILEKGDSVFVVMSW